MTNRECFKRVVIDTSERFVGTYERYRISIVKPDEHLYYDIEIGNHGYSLFESREFLYDMEAAIDFAVEQAQLLTKI